METSIQAGSDLIGDIDVTLTPYRQPLRTWAGRGTGATCHGCGGSIQPHEIEYEIELPASGGNRSLRYQPSSDAQSLRFHFGCYRNWTGR